MHDDSTQEIKECKNNNEIVQGISENLSLAERNEYLNLEANNAIEACEIEKITSDSLNFLSSKQMNEVEKEQNQETMTLKDKVHN